MLLVLLLGFAAAGALAQESGAGADAPASTDTAAPTAADEGKDAAGGEAEGEAADAGAGVDVRPARDPSPPTRLEPLDRRGLEAELGNRQARWLDTAGGQKFLVLELAHRKSEPMGAVVLLHGKDAHADWPAILSPLRQLLPDDGWLTLGMSLPYATLNELPKRELPAKSADLIAGDAPRSAAELAQRLAAEAEAPAEEGATEGATEGAAAEATDPASGEKGKDAGASDPVAADTPPSGADAMEKSLQEAAKGPTAPAAIDVSDKAAQEPAAAPPVPEVPVAEQARQRLEAAMNYLKGKGQENIVFLALGHSAEAVIDYFATTGGQFPVEGGAIVFIDPVFSDQYRYDLQSALGKSFRFPVLEVIDSRDALKLAQAKERLGAARRARMPAYQQARLPLDEGLPGEASLLTQRIRGWLKAQAPGFERTGK